MATLAFKKGKEFLWTKSTDGNEVYILGRRTFQRVIIDEESSAQRLIDSIGG
jgi:hypothetical protein